MITIYHNPRCSKSRQALKLIEDSGQEFTIVKYLENIPTEEELKRIITMLDITPSELVRTNEKIWKEEFKNKKLKNSELIKIMVENPKLIERPIVIKGKIAKIGRPIEQIINLLK